ncbi:MAG: 2-dehydropantoate 2-reductase [Anaerolineae bacterium]|nr:2-dehydropantoate 2-reductase [Anaerolineae bacterium]
MGCLIGARLSAHADVTLIGHWPEQRAALRDAPLRVIELDDREHDVRLRAVDDVDDVGPVDVALILTKTPKTETAADQVARILAANGIAITLQNGLGNQAILARTLGAERVTLGVTTLGAALDGPGVLRAGGDGATYFATRPEIAPAVSDIAGVFEDAGLHTVLVDEVASLVWGKLAVNAAINPLTALLRVPNGALLASPRALHVLHLAANEVAAVAAAQEIVLPFDNAAQQAAHIAHLTARNRSSMLQDVTRGVRTEIDAINGAVVRTGEALAVSTPVNRLLYELVKALEDMLPPLAQE